MGRSAAAGLLIALALAPASTSLRSFTVTHQFHPLPLFQQTLFLISVLGK